MNKNKILSPLEFYEKQFTEDAKCISSLKDHPFFSLNTMVKFTELYIHYILNEKND